MVIVVTEVFFPVMKYCFISLKEYMFAFFTGANQDMFRLYVLPVYVHLCVFMSGALIRVHLYVLPLLGMFLLSSRVCMCVGMLS